MLPPLAGKTGQRVLPGVQKGRGIMRKSWKNSTFVWFLIAFIMLWGADQIGKATASDSPKESPSTTSIMIGEPITLELPHTR